MSPPSIGPVVVKKPVNAFIPNALVKADLASLNVGQTIGGIGKQMGGLWVGGTAYLTDSTIEFHPNAVNRSLHQGDMYRGMKLRDIAIVQDRFGILTRIIDIIGNEGAVLTIRCFGARTFAERIRQTGRDRPNL